MIQVADMSDAGSPAVCRIVLSGLGEAVSVSQGGCNISGDSIPGMKAAFLRDGGPWALRQFPVFTEEEDTVSDAGYPAPVGCAF
ncbi:hypothetical protein [Roseibium aggregatum]|uniref:Uncharacterized protein n=1 Tax=Roseibium aggregatum TaxID=187304 RepID=A0A926NY58_9HYPH|nr:hypothetical protein [Roseibium aggregatum]MBD1548554.1 hypothetical protein [Roseibium aggregatum]